MNELVEIPGIKTLFNWPVFKLELIRDVSDVGISTSFSTSVIVNYRQGDEAFAFQMMRRRKEKLRLFIIKLSSAVCDLSRMFSAPLTGCVPKFLSAEPHIQGERPVVIFLAESQYVIKFRDPRPYLVLQYVLGDLESSIDLKLKPPKIYFNSSFDWYAMPYLESGEPARDLLDEEVFFYRLGAITAVAYFLQMTDIDSDNLI
ncbi:MAG: DUF4135 domain-containing protein, partial [Pseudomonadales bacterium]